MQGQKKYLVILCLLLFVFGGAYAGMRGYNGRQEEKENSETEASKIYVVREKAEEITAFSYQNGGDTLQFVKEGSTWVMKQDDSLTLNQTLVGDITDEIASLTADQTVENAGELSEYGFDKPGNIITFTTAEGTKTLTIGMENPVTGQYYVKIDGEDTLYLVSGSFPSVFSKSLEELKETTEDTEALQDSTKAAEE